MALSFAKVDYIPANIKMIIILRSILCCVFFRKHGGNFVFTV